MKNIHFRIFLTSAKYLAARYLVSNGYTITCRNYRKKYGEIDIIVEKDQHLVFVRLNPYLSLYRMGSGFHWFSPNREKYPELHNYILMKIPNLPNTFFALMFCSFSTMKTPILLRLSTLKMLLTLF